MDGRQEAETTARRCREIFWGSVLYCFFSLVRFCCPSPSASSSFRMKWNERPAPSSSRVEKEGAEPGIAAAPSGIVTAHCFKSRVSCRRSCRGIQRKKKRKEKKRKENYDP